MENFDDVRVCRRRCPADPGGYVDRKLDLLVGELVGLLWLGFRRPNGLDRMCGMLLVDTHCCNLVGQSLMMMLLGLLGGKVLSFSWIGELLLLGGQLVRSGGLSAQDL